MVYAGMLQTSEVNAAANLVGCHPVKNGQEQWPDPKATPIISHGTVKVTILQTVRPAQWWSKYHWLIECGHNQGRQEITGPSSYLADSLVEVKDQHGVKVWLQSSDVWLVGAAHPHP